MASASMGSCVIVSSHTTTCTRRRRKRQCGRPRLWGGAYFFVAAFFLLVLSSSSSSRGGAVVEGARVGDAWNWVWGQTYYGDSNEFDAARESTPALTMAQVSGLRVRELKRRLALHHGYDNQELAQMLDKKELIHALSFEEHKAHQKYVEAHKRLQTRRGIVVALLCVLVVWMWPLISHAWEVASINFVVYTDRKRYEARRCWEYRSPRAILGVLFMFAFDALQLWLSVSVLLSWVLPKNKYFFPVPNLTIRPAALLAASSGASPGPLGQYGFNMGPMIITWGLRFIHGKLEQWTGRAMVHAQTKQRQFEKQQRRSKETPEEKEARRAARAARRAQRHAQRDTQQQQQEQQQQQQEQQKQQEEQQPADTNAPPSSSETNPLSSEDTDLDDPASSLSRDEIRQAAAESAERRRNETSTKETTFSGNSCCLDDLD